MQPPASPVPRQAKLINTPSYGGYIDFRQLKIDMLKAFNAMSYSEAFELRLLEPNRHNPFRVYLELLGKIYIARVILEDYPFGGSWPKVKFEQLLPPCPQHPANVHPNVGSDGFVCFGKTPLVRGPHLVGFLNTLHNFLHNPNHKSPSGRNSLEAQQRAILERPISQSFETITLSVALTNNQELIFNLPSGETFTVFHWDVERLVRMLVPYIEQINYPR